MEKKKKRINLIYLPIIIAVIFGILMGLLVDKTSDIWFFFENGISNIIFILIELYLAVFLQIIFHELGHLIFGLLTGYKFLSYRIGNLMLIKKNKKIKLKRMTLIGTSGQCLMSPPDFNNGNMPFIFYNLGGIVLNILVSLASIFLYLSIDFILVKNFMLILFFVGIYFAIINGIPMGLAVNNDGYNVMLILKSKESKYSFWLQLKVNESLANDLTLKDIPWKLFKRTNSILNDTMVNVINIFECNKLLSERKYLKCYQMMDQLLSGNYKLINIHRYLLILDCVYCELILNKGDKYINKYRSNDLQRFVASMKNYPTVLRTNYAYALLIENNLNKALDIKNKFMKISLNYPYEGDIKTELELMEYSEQIREDM